MQDANSDGQSTADEIKTLAEAGVASINLEYSISDQFHPTGARLGEVSSYQKTDGTAAMIGEYWFETIPYDSVDDNVPVDIPENILALPDTRAMGSVLSLRKAMALDTTGTLVTLVNNFKEETEPISKVKLAQDILYFLTDADSIEPGSRGSYFDAKKLNALEKTMDTNYSGASGANPNAQAAPDLSDAYSILLDTYYCQLVAQTDLKEALPYIIKDPTTGAFDMSVFNSYLQAQVNNEVANLDVLLFDSAKYLYRMQENGLDGFDSFQNSFSEYNELIELATSNIVWGTVGNNTLFGSNGNDALYGDAGNDWLLGRDGND